jgi:hypothetical protein
MFGETGSLWEVQTIAKEFIKAHALRVERFQLGSSETVHDDMLMAMERIWKASCECIKLVS